MPYARDWFRCFPEIPWLFRWSWYRRFPSSRLPTGGGTGHHLARTDMSLVDQKFRPGRPAIGRERVGGANAETVRQWILYSKDFKGKRVHWTLQHLCLEIKEHLGVELACSTLSDTLSGMNLVIKRPRSIYCHYDSEMAEEFKKVPEIVLSEKIEIFNIKKIKTINKETNIKEISASFQELSKKSFFLLYLDDCAYEQHVS